MLMEGKRLHVVPLGNKGDWPYLANWLELP